MPKLGEQADVTADAEDSPASTQEEEMRRVTVKIRHEIKMKCKYTQQISRLVYLT